MGSNKNWHSRGYLTTVRHATPLIDRFDLEMSFRNFPAIS